MEFVETGTFTRRIYELLSDDDYGELQHTLIRHPEAGKLIRGGRGLRKIRWRSMRSGRGKRGGVRVIYYCYSDDLIYMLYSYGKSDQKDLTQGQLYGLCKYLEKGLL